MKYSRIWLLTLVCLFSFSKAYSISYKFDFTGNTKKGFLFVSPETVYGNNSDYGFDLGTNSNNDKSFFFSVNLPEGNYQVLVVLGSEISDSETTVKAESRRLMLANIKTEKGIFKKEAFAVNIRNTRIGDSDSVRIKPREIGKLIWDNKLTLEFNGINPSVRSIEIVQKNELPTIFLAGNSTVVDEGDEPWCGWGQVFPSFFTKDIAVANYAESGEAANTFVFSKRFAKLLTKMKKGDYLFIEFGHNDQKQKGEGKGPYTSYKSDLKYLADQAKLKGATPILVTSMHRRSFDENGIVINTHGDYPDAVRQLAKEENIALIDLNSMSKVLYEAWGVEGSKRAFVHYPANTFPNQTTALADNTHFNSYGGTQIAKCILKGIIEDNLPLKKYLRKEFKQPFDPANPDDIKDFKVPATPFFSILKPDGN